MWSVTIPAVRTAIIAGAALCWARALGEFGATVTFAGSFRGHADAAHRGVLLAGDATRSSNRD